MKKRVLLVLLLILALVLCACDGQAATPIDPSANDPVTQTPEQTPPVDPTPNDPPAKDPEPQVIGNPAISSFLDTLNAVLAENGHPITLTMADSTATTHKGDLKILYTGDGDDLYTKHLIVTFYQGEDALGASTEDFLYIRTQEDPSQEAKDVARILFQTALPLYDSILNEKYVQAFVDFSPEPNGGKVTYNRYGAAASVVVDENTHGIYTDIQHDVRGLGISRHDCAAEVGSYVQFMIVRNGSPSSNATMQPITLEALVKCLEQYGEVQGLDDRYTAAVGIDREFVEFGVFNSEIGSRNFFVTYRKADEGVDYLTTTTYGKENEQFDQWNQEVCAAVMALCGTEFTQEQLQKMTQLLDPIYLSEKKTFQSESGAEKFDLYTVVGLTTIEIFMELGANPLTEEELAEINTWFAWDGGPEGYPAGNSFLTCIYTNPSELNLFEVFGGQGGTDNQNGQISDAERNALAKVQEHYASGYEVQKFKRSSMDKLLKQYTGCKLKDHQWRDMDTFFVYLDNYDAYYTVYGGTNKSSYTMVDGWKNPDGTLSLVYKNDRTVYETGYEYCIVTLKPAESSSGFHGYWFVSNLPYIA